MPPALKLQVVAVGPACPCDASSSMPLAAARRDDVGDQVVAGRVRAPRCRDALLGSRSLPRRGCRAADAGVAERDRRACCCRSRVAEDDVAARAEQGDAGLARHRSTTCRLDTVAARRPRRGCRRRRSVNRVVVHDAQPVVPSDSPMPVALSTNVLRRTTLPSARAASTATPASWLTVSVIADDDVAADAVAELHAEVELLHGAVGDRDRRRSRCCATPAPRPMPSIVWPSRSMRDAVGADDQAVAGAVGEVVGQHERALRDASGRS